MSKAKIWWLAIRPKTLPAAVGPVFVGSALAVNVDQFKPLASLLALIGAILLQILSNLTNDYFDHVKGYDTEDRIGPTRVTQSGLLSLEEIKHGIVVNVVLVVILGLSMLYSVSVYSINGINGAVILIIIGLSAIIFAILYSGGPFPLSVLGLGDFFVYLFFGLIAVSGTYFVNTGKFELVTIIASIAPGFLITAILVVNNYRDYETDKNAKKRTLIVLFGEKFGIIEFRSLITIAYIIPLILFIIFPGNFSIFVLLPAITSPLAYNLFKKLNPKTPKQSLNFVLAETAKLSMIFSLVFSLGIVL